MIYETLFENAYNAARFFRKKNLQSLLTSESLAAYESLGMQYISDEEYKNTVLPYWEKYGRKPQKFWFELYGSREKCIEPRFIPADFYYTELIPYINILEMMNAATDKCYYDHRFPDVRQAGTICRRISGLYYDCDMRLISEKDAIRLCQDHGNKLVIKPSINSWGGENVHVIDPSCYDENGILEIFNDVGANFIAQSWIRQHPELALLNPDSVNTIRVRSLLTEDGVYIPGSVIRVGRPGDNKVAVGSGGFTAEILEDGTLHEKALIDSVEWKDSGRNGQKQPMQTLKWADDRAGGRYSAEYKIPAMDKIYRQIEKLHPRLAHFKWIGWDWTVDEEGEPVFIEFNVSPSIGQVNICKPAFGEMTDWILEDYFIHRTWEKNQKQGIICI